MSNTDILVHTLGFPRIGENRALKWATEKYWRGDISLAELEQSAQQVLAQNLNWQQQAGIDYPACGEFSLYDHIGDAALLFGLTPARFGPLDNTLDSLFSLARGTRINEENIPPLAMKKWFNTNYHYLVPELEADTTIRLDADRYLDQVAQAQAINPAAKPVLIGPLSLLWLSSGRDDAGKLALAESLAAAYSDLLGQLQSQGVEWVQLDEPILSLALPQAWRAAFESVYNRLSTPGIKILLASYFDDISAEINTIAHLPVDGIHIDAVHTENLTATIDAIPAYKVISLGVIDGRSIWRADLAGLLARLAPLYDRLGSRLWLAPSCSLLHVPLDAGLETQLPTVLADNLSFARQKLYELRTLATGLVHGEQAVADDLKAATDARSRLALAEGRERADVREKLSLALQSSPERKNPYPVRAQAQRASLNLPLFPTTTIGSFPQTDEIRAARRAFKRQEIDQHSYEQRMQAEIERVIQEQLELDIDMLVHGEPERNDMVEYFGEQLDGYAFTLQGWVQSYGSRCVKPPIIWGDVRRPQAMTVAWSAYAQSLTDRPVKGMLTGPVTMLQWSFVRDDISREQIAYQIGLALRDEINDLVKAGIKAIQVDEPAFREGLPLKQQQWAGYLEWAVRAFKLATTDVDDAIQIHTHMCYSEFNDIIESIAALDADVITIETTRSNMKLLDAFADFDYPNEIGPGVWDIHSPLTPTAEQIEQRLQKAVAQIPPERLWVNPDCGLKTRRWEEVRPALAALVTAAKKLRAQYQ
ncbi:MAG TPA: 5-methyltetrahydropteroyltriglutamate--homocysteine S-methyltransferase [Halothiobacillaceae bacterium]|nr:5-methyltetrahydropteroyltriglutamate--homocysteine S-methyltransferase [Halothiobacillaceae bacterium]